MVGFMHFSFKRADKKQRSLSMATMIRPMAGGEYKVWASKDLVLFPNDARRQHSRSMSIPMVQRVSITGVNHDLNSGMGVPETRRTWHHFWFVDLFRLDQDNSV